MDSNSHSQTFGSDNNNSRGTTLENFIFSNGLVPNNVGNEITFINGREGTIIDVTFSTPNVERNITDWQVTNDRTSSDHKLIRFSFSAPNPIIKYKRNFKKIDWVRFTELIDEKVKEWRFPTTEWWTKRMINEQTEIFTAIITEVLDEVAPYRPVRIKPSWESWWSDELQTLKEGVRMLHLLYIDDPTEFNKTQLNDSDKVYKRACRKARRNAWKKFTSDTKDSSGMSKFMKLIKNNPKYQVSILKKDDGTMTESPEESLALLMDKTFPSSAPLEIDTRIEIMQLNRDSGNYGRFKIKRAKWRTLDILKLAINTFMSGKSGASVSGSAHRHVVGRGTTGDGGEVTAESHHAGQKVAGRGGRS